MARWVPAFAVTTTPQTARVARPDMMFVAAILCSCLAAAGAMRATDPSRRLRQLAAGGAAAGLASVLKGPLGTAVPVLFGLLALQNGLVDQARLVAAFQAWTLDKNRPLA